MFSQMTGQRLAVDKSDHCRDPEAILKEGVRPATRHRGDGSLNPNELCVWCGIITR